jgi:hypothetical protein
MRTGTEIVGEAKAATIEPQPDHATSSSPIPNPSLRLDPALGLVVLEFRSDTGAVTKSIPSQRQLQAYQKWDATHFGPTPAGAPGANTHQAETPVHGTRQASAR